MRIRPLCRPSQGHRRIDEGDRRASRWVACFQAQVLDQAQATQCRRVTPPNNYTLTMGFLNTRSRKRQFSHRCAFPHKNNINTGLSLLYIQRQDLRAIKVVHIIRRSHNQWLSLKDNREPLNLLPVLHLREPRLSGLVGQNARDQIRL